MDSDPMADMRATLRKKLNFINLMDINEHDREYFNYYHNEVVSRKTTLNKLKTLENKMDFFIENNKPIERLNPEKKERAVEKFEKASEAYKVRRRERIKNQEQTVDLEGELTSERQEELVRNQIKDMEQSGLLRGILRFYANKGEGGPSYDDIISYYSEKLRDEEKKDIDKLKEGQNKIGDIKDLQADDLTKLSSYLGKLSKFVVQYIIPIGLSVGMSSYLLKNTIPNVRDNTLLTKPNYTIPNVRDNTLLTKPNYTFMRQTPANLTKKEIDHILKNPISPLDITKDLSTIKTSKKYTNGLLKPSTPPPLGEFGPPQGHIIARRGDFVYLRPFKAKYETANKQREETLRQRDIKIRKKNMM